MDKKSLKSFMLVALAASCWGTTGMCNRFLTAAGLDQGQIVVIRLGLACLVVGLIVLLKDRKLFKIKLRDLWCFLGSGLISLLMFSFCYFNAMQYMSLSAAAVLLYLAPVFVVLLSALFFKEAITPAKVLALVMVLLGAALSSGLAGGVSVGSAKGLFFGIMSGLGYALYSIFSRFALQRGYSSLTITFYTFLFSSLGALPIANVSGIFTASYSGGTIFWMIYLGLVTCVAPYLLYTKGLEGVENGAASIVASLELVVASLLGLVVFKESIGLVNALGVLLVLGGILVINLKFKKGADA